MIATIRPQATDKPGIVKVIVPKPGQTLLDYAQNEQSALHDALLQYGGVLIRGLKLSSREDLAELNRTLYGNALQYLGGISPRKNTNKDSFEASLVPKNMVIPQHREMGYLPQSPDRVSFYCHLPAQKGGRTPITDFEAVFNELEKDSPDEMAQLCKEGLRFNVTYWNSEFWNQHDNISIWGWQESFHCQTQDEMTAIAKKLNTSVTHHTSHSTLHSHVPLATKHPHRGTMIMLPLLYLSRRAVPTYYQLNATQRYYFQCFLRRCQNDEYEILTQAGDPLSLDFIERYHQAVMRSTVQFDWQAGDCLLLDNNWLGHGRTPYEGEREHWVSLSNYM